MMNKKYIGGFAGVVALSILTFLPMPEAGAADVEVTADISTDTTWTADNAYLLGKPIFVVNGATLTIDPGTTIYGYEDVAAGTFGSLVITRGSKIMAVGTPEDPIVFTAREARERELTLEDSSLWGGILVLGRAILNDANNPYLNPDNPMENTREVEGFPAGGDEANITYGGLDDEDDSGKIIYVSIRYGGFEFEQDNEINGLTLGAVGSGTEIHHVEVFSNSDDGVEFFGGTVNTHHMVMAFNEDDAFDIDQGYRGKNQFWLAIQKNVGNGSNHGSEADGGDSPDKTLEPLARTRIYNATYVGSGVGEGNAQDNTAFRLKDNWAGQYHNSIFMDFDGAAMRIDDQPTRDRANTEGDLLFANNLWYDIGSYDGTVESLTQNGTAEEIAQVSANGNTYANPYLGGTSRRPYGGLDPRPLAGGPAYTTPKSAMPSDPFYVEVDYKGAFSAEENWADGWTHLAELGYFKAPAAEPVDVEVTENITEDTVWTSDKSYVLGEPVFVTNGATLTIEAGTTIYGYEDVDAGTFGSLVITRGSRLYAEGTRENPIVFTARDARERELTLEDSSLWGGLIVLGRGVLNDANNPILNPDNPVENTREVEGFPTGGADENITYGGLDDADNSGKIRFCSILYGGFEFQQDSEINGLTLGAVGSGTEIEYVEVYNNSDDGIEFFGGTVDTRYMMMAFNEDDAFDIDQGYRGRGQFWFAIQKDAGNGSNAGAEHDGGDSPDKTLEPYARTKVYNATYLGSGAEGVNPQENGTFRLKDNWAGQYHNSVFDDFGDFFVRVDDEITQARIDEGELQVANSTVGTAFGTYDGTLASLTLNGTPQELMLLSAERGVEVVETRLRGISREADAGLDPRPREDSSLLGGDLSDFPAGQSGFFMPVAYRGAFGDVNWARGWTHVDTLGYFGDLPAGVGGDVEVTENITEDTTWTANNAYLLGKPVIVTNGATLTIEPGTQIYGYEDTVAGTFGSLVITRGSKIMAVGTAEDPIVFTAREARERELTLEDSSLWGGVIVLGRAILNDADNPFINPDNPVVNTREVEGFPAGGDEANITYGGLDDEDDSGKIIYVSIRYGGFEFEQDNEINGLTLGAVGRGTEIHHVEVFNNSDDGIEFFGGTVNTHHMVMAFNEDDAFDIDQGYRGLNQFWFAIQKDVGNGSNAGAEHDGGDSPDKSLEPYARTKIYNATYLGSGAEGVNAQENGTFRLKDNWAGQYHNSVFDDFGDFFVRVDDEITQARIDEGELQVANSIVGTAFGTYDGTLASLTLNGTPQELMLLSAERGVQVVETRLRGISRETDGGLDPRPRNDSPLKGATLSDFPEDDGDFFTAVDYRGAFGEVNWARGWTHMDALGYFGDLDPGSGDQDSDGDGQTDAQENLAGTDPNDAADYLRVMESRRTGGGVEITWSSIEGKAYAVEYSETMEVNPNTWQVIATVNATAGAATTSYTDNDPARLANEDGYYRARVQSPE